MAMALKSDVHDACYKSGVQKPIDLVHLSKMTMGDKSLEIDLLKMFEGQISQYEKALKLCETPEELKRIAHTIKGAARSIGAFKLAEVAQNTEKTGMADLSDFVQEISSVKDYIQSLI